MVGGAELEDNYVIKEGEKRGHEIIKVRPRQYIPLDADLYVFANIEKFKMEDLMKYQPYVIVQHDLRMPRQSFYKIFASKALISIYHSPAQRDEIFCLQKTQFHHFLHPLCLNERFKDLGLPRKSNPILYVGWVCWAKGQRNLEKWLHDNPNKEIDVYGKNGFNHPRMHYKGWVSQEELIKIYNSYDTLIFLPEEIQGCSRVVAEAYMCKVPNLICNQQTGFMSYGWTYDDYNIVRDKLLNGAKYWWEKVEMEMKNNVK